MNVEYIPPKPHYMITFQSLEFCVSQIPSSQVETNDDIEMKAADPRFIASLLLRNDR